MHPVADGSSEEVSRVRESLPGRQSAASEDLQRRNATLEAENRELQQLAKYHSVLLARLVHELRTPLTSIMGFAEILLSQEELTEAQRSFCRRIQNSAQQLRGSLNQLADLSRLESGTSEVSAEEFTPQDLLHESIAAVARQAQKQNVIVRTQIPDGLPPIVSDRGRLRQIIFNFLSFAITRTTNGQEVSLSIANHERGFVFMIEDSGESLTDLSLITEPNSSNVAMGTSELGLAVARHNVELLGAKLSFHNRKPRGLQTRIQIPTTHARAGAASIGDLVKE